LIACERGDAQGNKQITDRAMVTLDGY
jgi:hypothetical protein